MRYYFFLLISIFIFSCSSSSKKENNSVKPKTIPVKVKPKKVIPKKVKRDSLNAKNTIAFFTEYGKQNTETKVQLKTILGNIDIELYKNTPLHRASFIFLIKKGYFNTTCFHRVVPDFIIQGGSSENLATSKFKNDYKHYRLPPEFRKNRKHTKGSLAIARDWDDNPLKISTPFEFYITLKNEPHLNFEHTVFGRVTKGMNVVKQISKENCGKDEWPYTDVFISATVLP